MTNYYLNNPKMHPKIKNQSCYQGTEIYLSLLVLQLYQPILLSLTSGSVAVYSISTVHTCNTTEITPLIATNMHTNIRNCGNWQTSLISKV